MALATVDIVRLNGAGPTETSITTGSTRWSTSDAASPGANDPVPIPVSGTNFSYWVTTRLKATANASAHTIDNLRWFTEGSTPPTGVTYKAKDASSYVQATGTQGTTGTELTQANHAGLVGAVEPVSAFTYTTGSPLSVAGSTSSTGQFGDRVVYQVGVASTASPQTAPTETFTWRYDEA